MVMDFGFLKEFMMQQIHNFCDHGLCMSIDDPWLARMLPFSSHLYDRAKEVVASEGWYHVEEHRKDNQTKLLIIPFIPTAENLAEFWFKRLKLPITQYHPNVTLEKMYVWETPNSVAIYPTRATPYAEV
jgi:6-pyruvoyl-tetrahydropterin synthase